MYFLAVATALTLPIVSLQQSMKSGLIQLNEVIQLSSLQRQVSDELCDDTKRDTEARVIYSSEGYLF